MNFSSLFVSRRNYKIGQYKNLKKSLKHSLRIDVSENVDIERMDENMDIYLGNDGNFKLSKENGNRLKHLEDLIKDTTQKYKDENNYSKDEKNHIEKLKIQKKSTRKRLTGKDLSLEQYEESQLSREDYINQYWTKEYKSEAMTERMKKRTLESLEQYIKMKEDRPKSNQDKYLRTTTTQVQELIFKPTVKGGVKLSNSELKSLRDKVIKEEKEKGNKVIFVSFHKDESTNHIHLFTMNDDFKLLANQMDYINKKYNKNYDFNNMSKDELIEYGQIQQKHDYGLINSSLKQESKFVLRHHIDNISNEDRIEENKQIKRKIGKKSISNREFNNVNFEKLKLEINKRELAEEKLKQQIEKKKITIKSTKIKGKFSKQNKPIKVNYNQKQKEKELKQIQDKKRKLQKELKGFSSLDLIDEILEPTKEDVKKSIRKSFPKLESIQSELGKQIENQIDNTFSP